MSYTTQAAIEAELGASNLIQLTDDDNTGFLNSTVLNQVISNAENQINWKVSNIYDVPFSNPVPTAVQSMALIICCYRLYRRRLIPDEKNNFTEDYNDVMEFLNEVNEGQKHLDQAPPRSFPQGAVVSRPTTFSGGVFSIGGGTSTTM